MQDGGDSGDVLRACDRICGGCVQGALCTPGAKEQHTRLFISVTSPIEEKAARKFPSIILKSTDLDDLQMYNFPASAKKHSMDFRKLS